VSVERRGSGGDETTLAFVLGHFFRRALREFEVLEDECVSSLFSKAQMGGKQLK
jgi:hypothetical protein